MEILQLRYFLELANRQHVSKTAEYLHISQPSLSSTIKKMEDELGVPLFIRNGRGIVLSDYGKVYRDYAEDALLALDNGRSVLKEMHGERETTFKLGMLSPYVWADLISAFEKKYPEINISRYSYEGNLYVSGLLDNKIDLYLGGINVTNDPRLHYDTLYVDQMVLLVNRKNPLSRLKEVDLRFCENENYVNLGEDTNLQQFIDTLYAAANFKPNVIMECDYTLRDQMVIDNHGVSITTKKATDQLKSREVKAVKIVYPPYKRRLGLVWRKKAYLTYAQKKFIEFADKYYKG
ncbi:MAG: LysR family transcriptional regulator [Clostridia bacterium]|nr:LysR family transcriptional regulator [Clostridia bacterium]